MKQLLGMTLCFFLLGTLPLCAEESAAPGVVPTGEVQGVKAELAADKAKIAEEKNQMKASAKAARGEEKDLHQQIREAKVAGDTAKAEALRAQLKTTHQENVSQMKQDKSELKTAKQELRTDRKAAFKSRADKNKDGAVDAAEKAKAKEKTKKRGWWGR